MLKGYYIILTKHEEKKEEERKELTFEPTHSNTEHITKREHGHGWCGRLSGRRDETQCLWGWIYINIYRIVPIADFFFLSVTCLLLTTRWNPNWNKAVQNFFNFILWVFLITQWSPSTLECRIVRNTQCNLLKCINYRPQCWAILLHWISITCTQLNGH